jgi:putative ATP-dependent endonuclease of the OLD family
VLLRRIEIENFRGIAHGALGFGYTTILIGENGVGKSAFLDALALCLDQSAGNQFAFAPHDMRRTEKAPTAPIRIVLTFVRAPELEKHPPVWNVDGFDLPEATFELKAGPDCEGDKLCTHWWLRDAAGREMASDDPAVLVALRESHPVYLFRGGLMYSSPAGRPRQHRAESTEDPDHNRVRHLAGEIERYYERILHERTVMSPRDLERGFRAARELLERRGAWLQDDSLGSGRFLEELLVDYRPQGDKSKSDTTKEHGRGAWQIGVLIMLGAFVRSGQQALVPGAQPILAIEDPEAHLHPMTISSIWDLMDRMAMQKVISTHSGQLLSTMPLKSVRRLERHNGEVQAFQIGPTALDRDSLRRIGYHIRARRGDALFARCWLLVEGETEYWLLPELARQCGHDLSVEGVSCVEFAQCGIKPLIALARELGIEWHLLADGDPAGLSYVRKAREMLRGDAEFRHITLLAEPDVEHCLWHHGYAHVYESIAGGRPWAPKHPHPVSKPIPVVRNAIGKASKPFLALAVLEAISQPGSPGVPPPLRRIVEQVVQLARR